MEGILLLQNIFGCSNQASSPLLSDDELALASVVYNVAVGEVHENGYQDDDADSVISFDEKVETVKSNFRNVITLFKKTKKAKTIFLRNFETFRPIRVSNQDKLIWIADAIQLDRFNGNISKIVGGCVGFVGGVAAGASLLCPPLSPVILPLAIGGGVAAALGGATVVGTTGTEIVLLKNKMEEAQNLIKLEEENFSKMTHWFTHSKALLEAIEEILGFDMMQSILDEVKDFFSQVKDMKDLKSGKYNQKFHLLMKSCLGKMTGEMVAEFGAGMAPVIMSFVFVICLMSQRNRIVLSCALVTQRLAVGLMSFTGVGVQVGKLIAAYALRGGVAAGKVVPGAVARGVAIGAFLALGVALDVANVAISSREIHLGTLSKQAEAIRNAAGQLKEELKFLQSVYDELSEGAA